MMVKITGYVFDNNSTIPQTYGDSGKGVIAYLRKKIKHFKRSGQQMRFSEGRVHWLIELVEGVRDPWLKPLIAWRDTVSHFNPYIGIGFEWSGDTNEISVPMSISPEMSQPFSEAIERVSEILIDYSCEFLARALLCKIDTNIRFQPLLDIEKLYFGAQLGMDLGRARYKLNPGIIREYTSRDIEEALRQHQGREA
jgi:hypothetical protein